VSNKFYFVSASKVAAVYQEFLHGDEAVLARMEVRKYTLQLLIFKGGPSILGCI
jgi:hypothetical protein